MATNSKKTAVAINAPKTEAQKALETIDTYLHDHEGWTRGIAWHLHVFCRRQRSDDDSMEFESSILEQTAFLLDQLIVTFLHPKASKLFCSISGLEPKTLSEGLTGLWDLFNSFIDDDTVLARIERIEAGFYQDPCYGRTDKDFEHMRLKYARSNDLDSAKERIINYYKDQFK